MQVACEHCGEKYELDEASITGRGVRITCPACSHVFTVYRPQEELEVEIDLDADFEVDIDFDEEDSIESLPEPVEEAPESDIISEEIDESPELEDLPAMTEEALAALDVHKLDFRKVGLKTWKVRSSIGIPYEFSDYKTLARMIRDGRIKETDPLSHDGVQWTPINEIENLERHFCEVYLTYLKAQEISDASTEIFIPKQVKERIIQPAGGMNELAAAVAEATAEVDGVRSFTAPPPRARPKHSKPSRPPAPSSNSKSLAPIPILAIVGVVAAGVWVFTRSDEPAPAPVVNEVSVQKEQKPEVDQDAIRAEIQAKIKRSADKANAQQQEPETEEEPQLLVKIPDEILQRQQLANGASANAVAVSSPKADYAEQGRRAMQKQLWSEAVQAYQKAYKDNRRAEYKERWGYALYRSGKSQIAKPILRQAVQEGSKVANKWLGYIIREEGDPAGSNQYFTAYLKTNPSDAEKIREEMLK